MIETVFPEGIPLWALSKIGESGENDVITAGVITFGIAGVSLLYLYYLQPEMETGSMVRNLGYGFLLFAVLSLIWPWRPWPT